MSVELFSISVHISSIFFILSEPIKKTNMKDPILKFYIYYASYPMDIDFGAKTANWISSSVRKFIKMIYLALLKKTW